MAAKSLFINYASQEHIKSYDIIGKQKWPAAASQLCRCMGAQGVRLYAECADLKPSLRLTIFLLP